MQTKEQFIQCLDTAMKSEPKPLSSDERYRLTWEVRVVPTVSRFRSTQAGAEFREAAASALSKGPEFVPFGSRIRQKGHLCVEDRHAVAGLNLSESEAISWSD